MKSIMTSASVGVVRRRAAPSSGGSASRRPRRRSTSASISPAAASRFRLRHVRKAYVASDRHLGLEDASDLPPMLDVVADGAGERFDSLPTPDRQCPANVMRHLYRAMDRNLRVEIDYMSMSSCRTTSQWIAPAGIGFDGERLHFRAWSFRHRQWRDYVPVRVSDASTFATEPLAERLPRDEEWETIVRVALRPRSDLSEEQQQQAAREEHGFDGKELVVVETRAALAFCLDRR